MPGGVVCSVAICRNNSMKCKEKGENILFFTFPKDPLIRKEWVTKCYRGDTWSPDNKRICSKHFNVDDYEDEMQARLMNLKPKKLKKDAIPSLFLLYTMESEAISERSKRMQRNENTVIVEELTNQKSFELCKQEDVKNIRNVDHSEIPSSSTETDYILKRKFEALENENLILKQKMVVNTKRMRNC